MEASRRAPGKCCKNTQSSFRSCLAPRSPGKNSQPPDTHFLPAPAKPPGPFKSPLSDLGPSKQSFPFNTHSGVCQSWRGLASPALRGRSPQRRHLVNAGNRGSGSLQDPRDPWPRPRPRCAGPSLTVGSPPEARGGCASANGKAAWRGWRRL